MKVPAGDNHKRAIAASLGLVSEALCLFEEYARGRELRSACYEERNRLTQRQRRQLLAEIERVRRTVAQMKTDLALAPCVEDVGRKIWGRSVSLWETLAELESKRLKGYGPVSPTLAEYLDAHAPMLLKRMQAISSIAGGIDRREDGKTEPRNA